MTLPYILRRSGKNLKFPYYFKCHLYYLMPNFILRRRLSIILKTVTDREDYDYILSRVNYYNKLTTRTLLVESAKTLGSHSRRGNGGVYFFDSYEYTRWFPSSLKWSYLFGDVIDVPAVPSIVKSRPIRCENRNSVLLNMDKVRHFCFLNDKKSFNEKRDIVIFRGEARHKPHRIKFIEMYKNHPMCDICDVNDLGRDTKKITLYDHLDYKFIMALEGNDVASNLKWVMSTSSIAVMPRPTYETWFMEGQLIADYHYIEIKPDFSDLEERITFYINHPEKAQQIIENANRYVSQFFDKKREEIISAMVMGKYLKYTNDYDLEGFDI